jgi:predicted nucleic acid-binding protein
MRLVIDAGVAVQVALAGGNLGPLMGHDLVAPALLWSEAVSVLREMGYRGEIPPEQASRAIDLVDALPVAVAAPRAAGSRAYEVAVALGWAKTYDAEYVAVAADLDATLVTLDARLATGAARMVTVLAPADVPAV